MTIYLDRATYVDPLRRALQPGPFAVEGGADGGIAQVAAIPAGAEVLDCGGGLLVRAFAVGHHHAYSALARGMPPPPVAPRDFEDILRRVWWRLDRALDAESVLASALVTAADALLCGATMVVDHHSAPLASDGTLDLVAGAFDRAGVGHLLCLELSDRDGADARAAGLRETERYLAARRGLVGLHASFTVGDALLADAVALARQHATGVHIHCAEAASDEARTVAAHGCRVAERLGRAGALDLPTTILAHAIHLDAGERERVASSPAWVAQNPDSNRHNAVGTFDPRCLSDRIVLGTDGMHGDMLASLRAAYQDGQNTGGLSPDAAWDRLYAIDRYLAGHGIRRDNDLAVLDYDPPTPLHAGNVAAHAVYAWHSGLVRHVVARGRVVVKDRTVQTIDLPLVRARAREAAARLWARIAAAPTL